mgnify:CR=1 FL=1
MVVAAGLLQGFGATLTFVPLTFAAFGTLAGAQADVVEADTTLVEAVAPVLRVDRRERDPRAASDAVEVGLRVEQDLHLEEPEQRLPEGPRAR